MIEPMRRGDHIRPGHVKKITNTKKGGNERNEYQAHRCPCRNGPVEVAIVRRPNMKDSMPVHRKLSAMYWTVPSDDVMSAQWEG